MKKNPLLLLAALSLAALTPARAATADVLDAKPASLVKVLSEGGYKPQLRPGDSKTQPSIALKVKGDDVYLYFSGCKDGMCRRVTASNGFEFPKDRSGLAKVLADWNAEWYSQAYEGEDGVYLDASYLLAGGYTKANFTAWLDAYLEEYGDFGDKLY
ncbi:YbjN domain-containing protein [Deinococcus sp. SDU3-2]|uniref:YbjN domain-containing protein n=1 Tax=Deinococcus terrestris TaxID=2651870 RepID=A0A7X1NV57_9DEIO|nr:YbjN domain-containing protein [Deinococcus terrestris]MPY66412.1 YbjN domain-containing protein [Deinococcus terrestris]